MINRTSTSRSSINYKIHIGIHHENVHKISRISPRADPRESEGSLTAPSSNGSPLLHPHTRHMFTTKLVEAVRVFGCDGAATVIQARRSWWRWIEKEPGGVPKMETIPEPRWMVGVPKIGVCLR